MEKLTRLFLGTVRGSHAPTTRSDMSRGALQTLTLVVSCFLALMVAVICKSRQFYFSFYLFTTALQLYFVLIRLRRYRKVWRKNR